MSISTLYYRNVLLNIHRGNCRGVVSNAKPLFIIALIDSISEGSIIANNILFSENLKAMFKKVSEEFEPEKKPSPLEMPFFHMDREAYFFVKYKEGVEPPKFAHTPSSKFLRENVEYAYLDDQLWELLQDSEVRSEYRRAIVDYYLKKD